MYSRYIVCLTLVFLGITLGTFKAVSSVVENYEKLGKSYSGGVVRGVQIIYLLPPLVQRAIEKATHEYSVWLWNELKNNIVPSNYLVEGINDHKIIWYKLEINPSQRIVPECDTDDHKQLSYCVNLTRYYIRVYRAFYFNFTNPTYLENINHGYIILIRSLVNDILDSLISELKDKVKNLNLKIEVNKIQIIFKNRPDKLYQNANIDMIIIVELKITEDSHEVLIRLPYEVILIFYVDGGKIDNYYDPTWARTHIINYVKTTKSITISNSKCSGNKQVTINNCKCTSEKETEHYCEKVGTCYCCCDWYPNGSCKDWGYCCNKYVEKTKSITCIKCKNSGSKTYEAYEELKDQTLTVARAGYIALHYIYRIKVIVKYREDLSGIPFRASNIEPEESWIYTPFARTTGTWNNIWQPDDEDVNNKKPCFAFTLNSGNDPGYTPWYNGVYGIPNGAGYCNGKVYLIDGSLSCSDITPSDSTYCASAICACDINSCAEWKNCNKNECYGYSGYIRYGDGKSYSCQYPVLSTINSQLYRQGLYLDLINVFDDRGPGYVLS